MNYTLQRPTSPIDYEPPPLAPDDYIYPGSDEEEPVEEQEAQRRRIQLQSQHYLQDGQLFIFSAQLYGPFDDGWVNPWAGKRERQERNNGTVFDNGRMQVGGDTAESIRTHEYIRPLTAWPNREHGVRTAILDSRSNTPTQNPEQESSEGMLSTVTKLNPPAEDLQLLPCSKIPPAFEYLSLNREVGGGDLEFENANTIARAPKEIFRTPSFTLNVDTQESESTSGNRSAPNHGITPARRLQKFNRKRREKVQLNEAHPVEVRSQLEEIPPQPSPWKRRRL